MRRRDTSDPDDRRPPQTPLRSLHNKTLWTAHLQIPNVVQQEGPLFAAPPSPAVANRCSCNCPFCYVHDLNSTANRITPSPDQRVLIGITRVTARWTVACGGLGHGAIAVVPAVDGGGQVAGACVLLHAPRHRLLAAPCAVRHNHTRSGVQARKEAQSWE